MQFVDIVLIFVKQGKNIDVLKKYVCDYLLKVVYYFFEEYVMDCLQCFMVFEIVCEKLMCFIGEELLYLVMVEIECFDYNLDIDGFYINVLILVECIGQKKMVIGKNGEKIKIIGCEVCLDMEELFGCKVYLEIWVKVKFGWVDDECVLCLFGYIDDF